MVATVIEGIDAVRCIAARVTARRATHARPAATARAGRMARRLHAVAALLLAAALWPCAHAQEFETTTARTHGALVGNLFIGAYQRERLSARDWAQGFTTGAAPSGYALRGIELRLSFGSGRHFDSPTVTLHKDDPLNAALATLSGPAQVGTAPPLFAAPANTVLARNSTYYVVLEDGGSNVDVRVTATSTPATDRGGEADWSIAEVAHVRAPNSTSTEPFLPHVRALRLLVHGLAVGAELDGLTVTDANGAQAALSPAFATGTTAYVATADPDAGPLTVAATATTTSAVQVRDAAGAALADADTVTPGHQVAFDGHPVTVRIRVTAADGAAGTYALHLRSNDVLVGNLGQGGGYDRLQRIPSLEQEDASQLLTAGQAATLRAVRLAGVAHEPPARVSIGAPPEDQVLEYAGWAGGVAEYRMPAGRTLTLRQGLTQVYVGARGHDEISLVGTLPSTAPAPSPLDPGAAPGWALEGAVRPNEFAPPFYSFLRDDSPVLDRALRVAVLGSPAAPPTIKGPTFLVSNIFRPVLAASDNIVAQRISLADIVRTTFAVTDIGVHVVTAAPDLRLRLFEDADGAPGAMLAELVPAAAIVEGRVNAFRTEGRPAMLNLHGGWTHVWLVADRRSGLAGHRLGLTDSVDDSRISATALSPVLQRATESDDWSTKQYPLRMDMLGVTNERSRGHAAIEGQALTGKTLGVSMQSLATIEDDNGLGPFAYRWLRVAADDSETVIAGAGDRTYVVTEDDEGFRLKAVVSFRDLAGFDESHATDPTVVVTRPTSVRFNAPFHLLTEGEDPATISVELYQKPGDPLTFPLTVPLAVTYQHGASAADHSAVPAALTFAAPDTVETFTVSAPDDGHVDDGERAVIGFGTLPAGLTTRPPATATLLLSDPASAGDVRLTNQAGVPTLGGEGRLEVFYRGEWGTVCDDRFDGEFTIFGGTRRTVDNHAATFACGLMGYGAGEMIDNGPYRLGDSDPTPIWLDDVRCEEGGRHWTDEVPTQLDHCFHAGIGLENCEHSEDVALRCTEPNLQVAEPALRATVRVSSRTHDGTSAFTFRIAFTVAVTISPTALRDEALTVTGATLTAASPVDARGDLWELEARPTGTSDVVIEVPIRACSEAGALCTAAGLPLTQGAIEQIVYEPPGNLADEDDPDEDAPAPLTAEFTGVPAEHDGASAFTFRLAFSEDIRNGYRRVRDDLLSATGGTVTRAGRVNGRSDLWEIEVAPSGHGAVTVTLASGADCATAPCTSDGRTLSAPVSETIPGSPGLSVADAQVEEGPDATLAFPITLDRAASGTVTVRAATSDGTATAGEDYRAKTLTKTFAPGETRKVAVIRVLEDTVDDGGETMTLTLSNPSGAYLADAEATGTIGVSGVSSQALVDGAAVTLLWPAPRDGFGRPAPTDYAVRVNGAPRRVSAASLSGRTAQLVLASPVSTGDAVTVAYLGSAMHPLADASGLRSGPWDGLAAVNVTGTEYPLPVPVAPMPHGGDPLASAVAGALRLNASGAGLTDLPSLAHLTALERLDLSGNALTDLSPLSGLANLRDLDLSDNRIADLWPLAGLQGLERLDLSGNRVVDLWPLSGLSNLTVLVLDGNAVTDLGALTHLAGLENLGLAGTGVGDVTALQDLPVLRRLDLGGTGVANLLPLTDVGSLVWLSLPGNGLGAPETLGRLTRLRWVWSIGGAGTPANVEPDAVR